MILGSSLSWFGYCLRRLTVLYSSILLSLSLSYLCFIHLALLLRPLKSLSVSRPSIFDGLFPVVVDDDDAGSFTLF
jgi:hypothetical protein